MTTIDFSHMYAALGFEFRLVDLALLDIADDTPERTF